MAVPGGQFYAGPARSPRTSDAFALKELVAVVVVGALLIGVAVVLFGKARQRDRAICCDCNLKQIGLAFETWAFDHTGLFPMSVSTNFGGTREYIANGEMFRHFAVMSNELSTPVILACPADSRRPAKSFHRSFSNTNLSYFVGVDANNNAPQMFLSGYRNITGGIRLPNGLLGLTTNGALGWSPPIHRGYGNIALADGSVQQLDVLHLQEASRWTGAVTNRLAMP
jgi:prepilin-type processing-associated H-X9-DG protein